MNLVADPTLSGDLLHGVLAVDLADIFAVRLDPVESHLLRVFSDYSEMVIVFVVISSQTVVL